MSDLIRAEVISLPVLSAANLECPVYPVGDAVGVDLRRRRGPSNQQ